MSENSDGLAEQERRRKRINLYKRIIIIFIISIILLPTILCIFLFIKLNLMNKDMKELQQQISEIRNRQESYVAQQDVVPSFGSDITEDSNTETESDEAAATSNVDDVTTEAATTEAATTEVPTTEVATTEQATSANSSPNTDTQNAIKAALAEGRKVVYLTFDDGPYKNTNNLLDVLAKYNVKATFFVTGQKGYNDYLKRIVEDGHSIGLHSMSHDYSKVYASVESFAKEMCDLQEYIYNVTGTRTYLLRFPGGTSNRVSALPISNYIKYCNDNGFVYFDWNVSSGDGGNVASADVVYNNVMKGIKSNKISVVLMHDSYGKQKTFEAVPRIIEALQAQNALILPITMDTKPVHHVN